MNRIWSEMNEVLSAAIFTVIGEPGGKKCHLEDMMIAYGVLKCGLKEMKAKPLAPVQESRRQRTNRSLRKVMRRLGAAISADEQRAEESGKSWRP